MNKEIIENIREKLEEKLGGKIPGLFAITSSMGLQSKSQNKYWEKAALAGQEQTYQKDSKDIYWIPLTFDNTTVAVVGIKGHRRYPSNIAEVLEGLTSEIAFDHYLKEQTDKLAEQQSQFIKDLLTTNLYRNTDDAIEKGDVLGINLRPSQAVILFKVPGFYRRIRNKYRNYPKEEFPQLLANDCKYFTGRLSKIFNDLEHNIFTCLDQDFFVCLKSARGNVNTINSIDFYKKKGVYVQKKVKEITGFNSTVGIGQYYPGARGLGKSYLDALAALNLGEKIWGPDGVYHISDIGMFIALSNQISFERKCELAFQIMGPVFSNKSLLRTINQYLDSNMNLTDASKAIHLHRNTLIYRLLKIKKLIGLDPRNFNDAVQIKLGLLLYGPSVKEPESAEKQNLVSQNA